MFTAAWPGLIVLLSTVSSDAHTWNLVYVQLLLEDRSATLVQLDLLQLVLQAVMHGHLGSATERP